MGNDGKRKKRRRTRRRRAYLDTASVQRAIYLDFEGRTGKYPVLLGALCPPSAGIDAVGQYVVDDRYDSFGQETRCTTEPLEELVLGLVERAEAEKRQLVSWSEHDLRIVKTHCSSQTASRFAARYRNARAFAAEWRKAIHPGVEFDHPGREKNALANYLDFIECEVPEGLGPGLTGDHLRRLEGPVSAGKGWGQLTHRQKGYWTSVLGHNQHDVVGMYLVSQRAAQELAENGQPRGPSRPRQRTNHAQQTQASQDVRIVREGVVASFGGLEVKGTGEVRPVEGQTTSGVTAEGRAHIFEITGDGFSLEVGYVTWSTGDEDVQQLSRIEGDEPLDGLTRRLRISIRDRGDDKWMELEQARLDASGWVRSYKATLEELDEGAGISTIEVIGRLGGEVGTREDLLKDTGRRRSWLCVAFPAGSLLVPLAAFTLSRIAPVLRRVEA